MTNDRVARSGLITGIALTTFGLILLLNPLTGIDPWEDLWPFFILFPGTLFLLAFFLNRQRAPGLAVPGSIFTMLGLLLSVQKTFDYFQSWAYTWPLIPASVGIGLLLMSTVQGGATLRSTGTYMTAIGVGLTVVLLAIFEGTVYSNSWLSRLGWPLVLIALGVVVSLGSLAYALLPRQDEAAETFGEFPFSRTH